jgi:hypothetical protein
MELSQIFLFENVWYNLVNARLDNDRHSKLFKMIHDKIPRMSGSTASICNNRKSAHTVGTRTL